MPALKLDHVDDLQLITNTQMGPTMKTLPFHSINLTHSNLQHYENADFRKVAVGRDEYCPVEAAPTFPNLLKTVDSTNNKSQYFTFLSYSATSILRLKVNLFGKYWLDLVKFRINKFRKIYMVELCLMNPLYSKISETNRIIK